MRSTRISVGAESRDGCMYSPYENKAGVANVVTEGRHRDLVGGNWDALGTLQFEFLLAQGLLPNSYLLDIGAGCLRGGVRYAEYLAPGHYFGVDAHQSLLDAGYDIELAAAGLRHKVPRSNLLASESFEFELFNRRFDFAIAQSLFTHLPLNNIRLCLAKLAAVMAPGGKFFATFFERPADIPEWLPCKEPKQRDRHLLLARPLPLPSGRTILALYRTALAHDLCRRVGAPKSAHAQVRGELKGKPRPSGPGQGWQLINLSGELEN